MREEQPGLFAIIVVGVLAAGTLAGFAAGRMGRPEPEAPARPSPVPSSPASASPRTGTPPLLTAPATPSATPSPPLAAGRVESHTAVDIMQVSSVLQRRDPVPVGVAAVMGSFSGGNADECALLSNRGPALVTRGGQYADRTTFTIGSITDLCLLGFRRGPAVVTITGPDGSVQRHTQCVGCDSYGEAYVTWSLAPGDPIGTHTLAVVQGPVRWKGKVKVRWATERFVRVLGGRGEGLDALPRGVAVPIALGGFRPRERVSIHLYRGDVDEVGFLHGPYITTLRVRMDKHGQLLLRLPTQRSDAATCYFTVTNPPVPEPVSPNFDDAFCLE